MVAGAWGCVYAPWGWKCDTSPYAEPAQNTGGQGRESRRLDASLTVSSAWSMPISQAAELSEVAD
jgi:hypothetical protein